MLTSVPSMLGSSFSMIMITKSNFVCYDNFNSSLIFSEAWRKTLLNVTCSCHMRAFASPELSDLFWQTNRWQLNPSEWICIKTTLGAVSEKLSVIFLAWRDPIRSSTYMLLGRLVLWFGSDERGSITQQEEGSFLQRLSWAHHQRRGCWPLIDLTTSETRHFRTEMWMFSHWNGFHFNTHLVLYKTHFCCDPI